MVDVPANFRLSWSENRPPLDLELPVVLYGDTETGVAHLPSPPARPFARAPGR